MTTHPIASDLSYDVLLRRRLRAEMATPVITPPQQPVIRLWDGGDGAVFADWLPDNSEDTVIHIRRTA